MTVVTADIAVSLDGYAAGPNQSEYLPFGEGVDGRLHTWMFDHADENRAEIDGIVHAGAYIMGRNMFGPGRADWDLDWKGWWGPQPPYHAPVFVLTHHHRDRSRWTAARHSRSSRTDPSPPLRRPSGPRGWAVGDRRRRRHPQPVPVAGAIDELRLHVVPITLGAGERVFDGVGGLTFGIDRIRPTGQVVHITLRLPAR
jgi:dihydrofolate reductase